MKGSLRHRGRVPGSYALWSDNPSELDLLAFSAVAETVASALLDDHLDPLVLGVSGRWSGCTTFRSHTPRGL